MTIDESNAPAGEKKRPSPTPRTGEQQALPPVPTGGTGIYDEMTRADALDFAAGSAAAEISESLSDWWGQESTADMLATVPKAIEYGSSDLRAMGQQLVALHPNVTAMDPGERDRVGQEMAIAFYLLGKITRLFGAYERGAAPSDDTIHDVTVYSMMFRRVRATGGWPN